MNKLLWKPVTRTGAPTCSCTALPRHCSNQIDCMDATWLERQVSFIHCGFNVACKSLWFDTSNSHIPYELHGADRAQWSARHLVSCKLNQRIRVMDFDLRLFGETFWRLLRGSASRTWHFLQTSATFAADTLFAEGQRCSWGNGRCVAHLLVFRLLPLLNHRLLFSLFLRITRLEALWLPSQEIQSSFSLHFPFLSF